MATKDPKIILLQPFGAGAIFGASLAAFAEWIPRSIPDPAVYNPVKGLW